MKYTTIILIAVALVAPLVGAAPSAQTGDQRGGFWSSSTFVAAQGGTDYALVGAIGDHDVIFYNAAGYAVGAAFACGPDQGSVPASAVLARIMVWDTGSVPGTCIGVPNSGSSTWVYVDGL